MWSRPVACLNVVLPSEMPKDNGSTLPAEEKQSVSLLNILEQIEQKQ